MKKETSDHLFDKHFQESLTKDSLKEIPEEKKKSKESALAMLIGYVLKWKRNEMPRVQVGDDDFRKIRHESLEIYRRTSHTTGYILRKLPRVAAAASILIILGVASYLLGEKHYFSSGDLQARVIEFKTPRGQQSEVTLPDGTFVALNYDSKLKYHISPDKKLQEIELVGEAYFKVTHNKSRVFRVITPNMSVNVLGTQFDVRAYPEDSHTETTLLKGVVEIKDIPQKKAPVMLSPGEQWSYDKNTGQDKVEKTDASLVTTWRTGEYHFNRQPLNEIAKTLDRMYKVNIHFRDAQLGKEVFSGAAYKDDNIEKFFALVNLTIPIKVQRDSTEIYIERK